MASQTSAGTKIFIGGTGALSEEEGWKEIGEVVGIPQFGRTYAEVTHMPLGSRGVQKAKGSYNDGDMAIPLAQDLVDEGQAAAMEALNSDDAYNFKVEQNDAPSGGKPTTHIYKALVLRFAHDMENVDSIVGSEIHLSIVSGTMVTTAATI